LVAFIHSRVLPKGRFIVYFGGEESTWGQWHPACREWGLSPLHKRNCQLGPKCLAAERLQSVICGSRAESVTGWYVFVPKIRMFFCGNFRGNALNITVASPPQELSQQDLLLF